MPRYQDDKLSVKEIPSFRKGYSSYTQGKSTCDDEEFPYGVNVVLDNNGSATKRAGSTRYGGEVASGKATRGMGILKTSTLNELIVAAGTAWYNNDGTTNSALTGFTFTDNLQTHFCQAGGNLYGANGTDNLCYTNNGTSVTEISSNGNKGLWPVFYNQRLYMTNTANPDRIYYSNPYAIDLTASPPTITWTNFATFNTDLSATPKKNAGYITLFPGSGVEITRLFLDNSAGSDYLYAYTKSHGIWRISASATANSDGSINHNVSQVVTNYGATSGRSVIKVGNDQWFYDRDNYYSLGEVAQYQNIRVSTKTGRVRTEIASFANKSNVASGFYKDKLYISYQNGSYNDRILVYDVRLNAWGAPIEGINANDFIEYEDDSGVRRFLVGSSNSSDSYIYELESGTDDQATAVSATFETKSTDCDKPGLIKYFAFIDVFYTMVYGVLTYEVFIDEVSSVTGQVQLGNSSDYPAGVGSLPIGSFTIGNEFDPNTTFASLQQNNSFRIDCNYTEGKKISVRFTNNVTGEQFKIDKLNIWYIQGDVQQQ